MTQSGEQITPQAIVSLLENNHITEAIRALHGHTHSPEMLDKLREAEMIYTQLLRFFASGAPDSQRATQLDDIKESLYVVTDAIVRRSKTDTTPGRYYSCVRSRKMASAPALTTMLRQVCDLADKLALMQAAEEYDVALRSEFDSALSRLFEAVWVTHTLTAQETEAIQKLLASDHILNPEAADEPYITLTVSLLSALLLGALKFYDRRKLEVLIFAYLSPLPPLVRARGLVGASILLMRHGARAATGLTLSQLSSIAIMDANYGADVRALVTSMLRTRDTDRVNRKLKDEIIPDLMKLKPELEKRIRAIDPEDMADETPKWMEMLEESGAADKLKEFTEMQMQGADVFMGAFAGMKSFPFFREPANWFLPFNTSHSQVHRALEGVPEKLARMMLSVPLFCSSDKFSLAFSISRMPAAQAEMMTSQMGAQMDALSEEQLAGLENKLRSNMESEINVYLKDLFRFFRLSEFKSEVPDPFAGPFTVPDAPLFEPLKNDEELQRLMADFYFRYGYWSDAAAIYGALAAGVEARATDAQKHGYCLEKLGNIPEALRAYRNAELIEEADKWLLKRIAACLRASGKYTEAAAYYARVLEKEPDNLRIELLRGHALLEAGNVKEALKCYYKVDYLEVENTGRAMRPIAWCEFLQGDYDKSLARYRDIINSTDASASDYLNYGHVLFASRNIEEARVAYREVVKLSGAQYLYQQLEADAPTLKKAGLSQLEISLMADLALS